MSVGVSRFEACEWLDNGRDFAGLAEVIVRVCINVWILFERFGIRALLNGAVWSQPARGKCGRSVRHYSSEASDYVVLVHRVKSGNRVRPLQVSWSSQPFRPDIRVYLRARISVHVLSSQGGILPPAPDMVSHSSDLQPSHVETLQAPLWISALS